MYNFIATAFTYFAYALSGYIALWVIFFASMITIDKFKEKWIYDFTNFSQWVMNFVAKKLKPQEDAKTLRAVWFNLIKKSIIILAVKFHAKVYNFQTKYFPKEYHESSPFGIWLRSGLKVKGYDEDPRYHAVLKPYNIWITHGVDYIVVNGRNYRDDLRYAEAHRYYGDSYTDNNIQ